MIRSVLLKLYVRYKANKINFRHGFGLVTYTIDSYLMLKIRVVCGGDFSLKIFNSCLFFYPNLMIIVMHTSKIQRLKPVFVVVKDFSFTNIIN